jgi:hypothetical protein
MRTILSYSELLTRARAESARLLAALTDLRNQDYELSTLRNRVDLKFLDHHHNQRKELFASIFYVEADLRRSQGREAILLKKIANGEVREPVKQSFSKRLPMVRSGSP